MCAYGVRAPCWALACWDWELGHVRLWLLVCPQPSFRSQFEICACGFHSRQHAVCTLWPYRWHAHIIGPHRAPISAPTLAPISAPISAVPYRWHAHGCLRSWIDTCTARCVIVVNGPPPVRLHLSVHVIVHGDCLVALVMDCCGPRVPWGSGRGRLMRAMLNSSSGTGVGSERERCGRRLALRQQHLKMKIEKERHAYVQERRRNPCDQLCTTTVEDTTHNRVGSDRSW